MLLVLAKLSEKEGIFSVDGVRVIIILFIFRIPLIRFSMKRDITSLLLEVMLCEWNAVKSCTPHNLYVPNFLQCKTPGIFLRERVSKGGQSRICTHGNTEVNNHHSAPSTPTPFPSNACHSGSLTRIH